MKACPFCGSDHYLRFSGGRVTFYIVCDLCVTVGPVTDNKDLAEKAWDQRA